MKTIKWKIFLESSPGLVYNLLSNPDGITKFWSEKATIKEGVIHFVFPNGQTYNGRILKAVPNKEFHLDYFYRLVKFLLKPSENNGTELTLINENINENEFNEVYAGWVSVLMNLKAVADFQCDLRNHNPKKTWDEGYANN